MAESPIDKYLHTGSLEQSSWRSVALFGKNTASYKFALALSLMQLAQQGRDTVMLAARICEHAKAAPRQSTNRSKKFLDACLGFNAGMVTLDELTSVTVPNAICIVTASAWAAPAYTGADAAAGPVCSSDPRDPPMS